MFHLMSAKWVLAFACIAGVAVNGVAMAHGGGGHGGGGHGGGHMGGGGHVGGGGHTGGGGYHHSGGGSYHHGVGGFYGGGLGGFGLYYGSGLRYPGSGYGGYPSYGYAQPVYATPVYSQQVYNQPVYSNTVYSGNSPFVTSSGVVTSAHQVTYDNGEIVLFSPPTNTQDAQYTLNGNTFSMKPGTIQKFTNDRNWTIDVNLGNGQTTKYTLSTGRYKFKQSDKGMGLFTTQDQPGAPVATGTSAPTTTPAPSPMPVE